MSIKRRDFLKVTGAATAAGMVGFPYLSFAAGKKVVVVGGGTGGATAAKYIKMADSSIDVTIIEPNKAYHTCYMSNEVLSGERTIESIAHGYDGLKKHGINVVHDMVTGIDAGAKKVMTKGGQSFDFDRCVRLAESHGGGKFQSQLPLLEVSVYQVLKRVVEFGPVAARIE